MLRIMSCHYVMLCDVMSYDTLIDRDDYTAADTELRTLRKKLGGKVGTVERMGMMRSTFTLNASLSYIYNCHVFICHVVHLYMSYTCI